MTAPLAHLRVVDLTDLRGALAGRMLADLGADVVKVEPPGGDPGRAVPPFAGDVPGPDRSLPFLYRNLGKRGAVIDLGTADGRRRFGALCGDADVLIENVGAGEPWLAPAAVRARHPHLVHVAIADFGLSGSRAGWRLEPLPAFAATGALWASGFSDRPPCWLPGYQAHDAAAVIAVTGALAALLARARDGRGQTVEVAVQEAGMASLDPWGIVLRDYAARYPALPPIYPRDADGPAPVVAVADGWVRLLAVTPRQLRALVALLTGGDLEAVRPEPALRLFGRSTWSLLSTGFAAAAEESLRAANLVMGAVSQLPGHPTLLPVVHAAFAAFRTLAGQALARSRRDEVVARGLRLGLPIAPVHRPEEFVAAEQTRVRAFFRRTGFPHLGDAPVAIFPANLSVTPAVLARPAPALGEDSDGFAPRGPHGGDAREADRPVLAGTRVVNLGVGAVGPEACGMLAHLGAEVVKIESAASPDFLRRLTVEAASPDCSFMFNDENRGQRSVCLDLGTARGRELALRLCAGADVVVENRQAGMVERFGLDYEAVRRVRPDVVYASSQGYGAGGPLGTAPSFGPTNAAFAGLGWLWSDPEGPYPAGASLEHPDHLAGKLLALAVLAALEHRRRTGEGQRIELAQTEAAAYLLGEFYLEEPCTGHPVVQRGNAVPYACPHGVYSSRGDDRWVAIAVVGDDAWERFRAALGWDAEARLTTLSGRLAARAELDARIGAWTRERTAENAASLLQTARVSAFPVQGPDDHRADPHLLGRGALVRIEDPEVGSVLHVANPLRFSDMPVAPARPAPRLGADTEAVLVEVLGLEPAEVRRLVAEGVAR
ncbi:MAG TPA: CoA transferase [Candidatus Binatia bacterium]|nr:CoA transferase [Candidatus Binatia bacterium]